MAKKGSYNPGPLSDLGKEASSANATVHGGRSERHSILPWERAEDFDALVTKWMNEFSPYTDGENGQVRTIAEREWMMLRCERNVNCVLSELMLAKASPLEWTKEEQGSLTLMQRYLTTAERQLEAAVKVLKDLRKHRVEQKKLEENTKLKMAEASRKLQYAGKLHEASLAVVAARRVQKLRALNVTEWDLAVLRAKEQGEGNEREATFDEGIAAIEEFMK